MTDQKSQQKIRQLETVQVQEVDPEEKQSRLHSVFSPISHLVALYVHPIDTNNPAPPLTAVDSTGEIQGVACICCGWWLIWSLRSDGSRTRTASALYDAVQDRLLSVKAPFVRIPVAAETEDHRFFLERGFQPVRQLIHYLQQSLGDFDPLISFRPRPSPGLTVNSLEEERVRSFRWVTEVFKLQTILAKQGVSFPERSLGTLIKELCNLSGSHPRYFLARWRGKPVGLLRIEKDPWNPDRALITGVGVRQTFQGRGIGSCLIHRALQWARDSGFKTVAFVGPLTDASFLWLQKRMGFVPNSPYAILIADAVRLQGFNERWHRAFLKERERILTRLGSVVQSVEHIGSTAIPYTVSRPIVDILIVTASRTAEAVNRLEGEGYERWHEGDGRVCWLRKRGNGRIGYQAILCDGRYSLWKPFIAFRDYLRSHVALAEQYAMIKERLAKRFPFDEPSYNLGKAAFIEIVLIRAGVSQAFRF